MITWSVRVLKKLDDERFQISYCSYVHILEVLRTHRRQGTGLLLVGERDSREDELFRMSA